MIEYDDEQYLHINQLFKTLNIENLCSKIAPYNNIPMFYEYAPYDLELEEECFMGFYCIFKNTPSICPKNHQGLIEIKKNTKIHPLLCKYERPWKVNKDETQMKCNNITCWFSHLKGRKEHINKLLLKIFVLCEVEPKVQNQQS